MTDISLLKSEMRRQMKMTRAQAFEKNKNAAFDLRDQFLKSIPVPPGSVIASYCAIGSEIDPAPVTDALRQAGYPIVLPVMMSLTLPLSFRQYQAEVPLIRNRYGIEEPGHEALTMVPDILLVPLLAFGRDFSRLGTGAGYYDRTLQALRAKKSIVAIGLAFSVQEVPQVPTEDHDAPLDRIATEIRVF